MFNFKQNALSQTSKVSRRDWLTVLMMHAASVYNPAGDIANFLAASWQRRQYFKHCRHAFSSNVIRRWFAGVHFVCVPFCWIVFKSSSNSVTPSIGSPTNSCTKLQILKQKTNKIKKLYIMVLNNFFFQLIVKLNFWPNMDSVIGIYVFYSKDTISSNVLYNSILQGHTA